jgi:hypothetical protein
MWSSETGHPEGAHRWLTTKEGALGVTPDGKYLLTGSQDLFLVTALATGATLKQMSGHTGHIHTVVCGFDNRTALTGGGGRSVDLWDLASGRLVRRLGPHGGRILSLALTHDGRVAISSCKDNAVYAWEVSSGRLLGRLLGHTAPVLAVRASPDGRVVTASSDATIRLWHLDTRSCSCTLEGHTDSVTGLALTPDGSYVVSCSLDGTVRVWDIRSGVCLATARVGEPVSSLSEVGPDGRFSCGTTRGRLRFMKLQRLNLGRPIVVLGRRFRYPMGGKGVQLSGVSRETIPTACDPEAVFRDENPSGYCPWCGGLFSPPPSLLARITSLCQDGPDAPSLAQASSLSDDRDLESTCPHCGKPVRIAPVVAVGWDNYFGREPGGWPTDAGNSTASLKPG